jgi:hypothetical protein
MLFETSGWALPKNIAPQKQPENKKKGKGAEPENTKEEKVSKEADQLQAQLATLNDQPKNDEGPKTKKPRVRNKKRPLEKEAEKPVQNKKAKKNDASSQTQQQPTPQEPSKKKNQQKKKLQDVNTCIIILSRHYY